MKKILQNFHSGRAVFFLMVFICIVILGAVLKLAAAVILPFTIAFMLALVMYPLITFLDKFKIKRLFSIILCVIIIGFALYLFGIVIFTSGRTVVSPALFDRYENRLTNIYIWIARTMELPYDESLSFWQNLWGQLGIRTWVYNFATSFFAILINFITSAIMVIIFMAFILLEASFFKEKLGTAFGNNSDRIDKMGQDLMYQVTRYLTVKFVVSLGTGVIVAFGLWLIKIEFAIVWGLIAFILNFIPTFGSIASGAVTTLFALVQFWEPGSSETLVPAILTLILMVSVNMIIGNVVDPKLIGDNVGISPLAVLGSLALWGWIWGFAGMILAVPMTVIVRIICENIPYLKPVSIMLGSRKAVTVKRRTVRKKAEEEKSEAEAEA